MCDYQPGTQLIPSNALPPAPAVARGMARSLRHVRQLELFLGQPYRRIGALLYSGHRPAVLPGGVQKTLWVGVVVQT